MLSMKLHTLAACLLLSTAVGGAFTLLFVNVVMPAPTVHIPLDPCEKTPGQGKALKHVEPVNTGSHKGY